MVRGWRRARERERSGMALEEEGTRWAGEAATRRVEDEALGVQVRCATQRAVPHTAHGRAWASQAEYLAAFEGLLDRVVRDGRASVGPASALSQLQWIAATTTVAAESAFIPSSLSPAGGEERDETMDGPLRRLLGGLTLTGACTVDATPSLSPDPTLCPGAEEEDPQWASPTEPPQNAFAACCEGKAAPTWVTGPPAVQEWPPPSELVPASGSESLRALADAIHRRALPFLSRYVDREGGGSSVDRLSRTLAVTGPHEAQGARAGAGEDGSRSGSPTSRGVALAGARPRTEAGRGPSPVATAAARPRTRAREGPEPLAQGPLVRALSPTHVLGGERAARAEAATPGADSLTGAGSVASLSPRVPSRSGDESPSSPAPPGQDADLPSPLEERASAGMSRAQRELQFLRRAPSNADRGRRGRVLAAVQGQLAREGPLYHLVREAASGEMLLVRRMAFAGEEDARAALATAEALRRASTHCGHLHRLRDALLVPLRRPPIGAKAPHEVRVPCRTLASPLYPAAALTVAAAQLCLLFEPLGAPSLVEWLPVATTRHPDPVSHPQAVPVVEACLRALGQDPAAYPGVPTVGGDAGISTNRLLPCLALWAHWAWQLATAVRALHSEGITHGRLRCDRRACAGAPLGADADGNPCSPPHHSVASVHVRPDWGLCVANVRIQRRQGLLARLVGLPPAMRQTPIPASEERERGRSRRGSSRLALPRPLSPCLRHHGFERREIEEGVLACPTPRRNSLPALEGGAATSQAPDALAMAPAEQQSADALLARDAQRREERWREQSRRYAAAQARVADAARAGSDESGNGAMRDGASPRGSSTSGGGGEGDAQLAHLRGQAAMANARRVMREAVRSGVLTPSESVSREAEEGAGAGAAHTFRDVEVGMRAVVRSASLPPPSVQARFQALVPGEEREAALVQGLRVFAPVQSRSTPSAPHTLLAAHAPAEAEAGEARGQGTTAACAVTTADSAPMLTPLPHAARPEAAAPELLGLRGRSIADTAPRPPPSLAAVKREQQVEEALGGGGRPSSSGGYGGGGGERKAAARARIAIDPAKVRCVAALGSGRSPPGANVRVPAAGHVRTGHGPLPAALRPGPAARRAGAAGEGPLPVGPWHGQRSANHFDWTLV